MPHSGTASIARTLRATSTAFPIEVCGSGSHVVDRSRFGSGPARDGEVCLDHVVHVHEVPRDLRGDERGKHTIQSARRELGHEPGWLFVGTVHRVQAKRRDGVSAPRGGRPAVQSRGELGHGIVARWPRLFVLGRSVIAEAVLRGASRVHQDLESNATTGLDQVNGPEHVRCDHRAEAGLFRIGAVRREVEDPLRTDPGHELRDRGLLREIDGVDPRLDALEAPEVASRSYQSVDFAAVTGQPAGEHRAHEPRRSGNEGWHAQTKSSYPKGSRYGRARRRTSSRSSRESSSAVARFASGVAERIVPQG